ncbi:Bromodomain adjacent to zinc finger domain protein 2B [Eumeta japonica]|uniref:Bromodomain adjacent to zinc finger domain protein 2B n=1 Tax=Eumeta variegata TaxID=151549 RepID=A0A4C1WQJ2_EUMVA|nr:Bromodomain adjacent to zinc finger domain protein 2B [Eumeta japonica]
MTDTPCAPEASDDVLAPVVVNNFKGFEQNEMDNSILDYRRVLERLEEELACDEAALTPVRYVSVAPAGRRIRRDRDAEGSRPSSALSVRSDVSALGSDAVSAPSSPAGGGGRRRPTADWSSALLRAPLEQGWRRELVYRATLDHHSRRNADIYYYTPAGKKLRSTREIAENLSGTGFALENFSFFKEPLGLDDPEKEIIRDAKVIRRLESPQSPALAAAPVEGKRTPKPKLPKGATPPPAPASGAVVATEKIKLLHKNESAGQLGHVPPNGIDENQKRLCQMNTAGGIELPIEAFSGRFSLILQHEAAEHGRPHVD